MTEGYQDLLFHDKKPRNCAHHRLLFTVLRQMQDTLLQDSILSKILLRNVKGIESNEVYWVLGPFDTNQGVLLLDLMLILVGVVR